MDNPSNNGKQPPLSPLAVILLAVLAILIASSCTLLFLMYPEVIQFIFGEPTPLP
jgi:hypothetical protein